MSGKRILIVEDERDMADLVAMGLQREGYQSKIARDGLAGLDRARQWRPDVILLDIMLPQMSGTEVLRHLRDDPNTADAAVIMLTAKSAESDIVVGLHLGADDYVTKPFSMAVLIARIAAVLRRREQTHSSAGILDAGPVHVNQQTHEVTVEGEAVSLTLTEFRILVALIAGRGRVLTRDQLIDRAMGPDAVVTDRTIDVHLTALRRKLGPARSMIGTVRGVGYQLVTHHDEIA